MLTLTSGTPPAFPFQVTFDGGPGKKELGTVEVIEMLALRYAECNTDKERMNPQEGTWFYERDPQMRRHFRRQYPEFFAPLADFAARQKRQEREEEAQRTKKDRIRRGRITAKIPAVGPKVVDIQDYRRTGN